MRRQAERTIPDDDGTIRDLYETAIAELPLRSLATMGRGMTPATLDRLIDALNGHWIRAILGR
jgi:hypothetical protein